MTLLAALLPSAALPTAAHAQQDGGNLGGGFVSGAIAFADPVPADGACHATDFTAAGEAQTFVVNTARGGYVGSLQVTATAHDGCANGATGTGPVSVTASGASPTGTLECGPLTGDYVRVGTTGTIDVSGPCSVNGVPTDDVRFVGQALVVPDGTPPFATARFAVPFSVAPDIAEDAAAAANLTFEASGTLSEFPCPDGCDATFNGTATGAGTVQAERGGAVHNAAFTIDGGALSGSANYTEPGSPLCPAFGSATGTVTVSGGASGVVHRTNTPAVSGTVTDVRLELTYTYARPGSAALIVITGGTATISFTFPDTGADSFSSSVIGSGLGAFVVDPQEATARCEAPGSLPFTITGDAAIAPVAADAS